MSEESPHLKLNALDALQGSPTLTDSQMKTSENYSVVPAPSWTGSEASNSAGLAISSECRPTSSQKSLSKGGFTARTPEAYLVRDGPTTSRPITSPSDFVIHHLFRREEAPIQPQRPDGT